MLHHPNTAEGADTYESWTEAAGFNSPRTIVTDIGTNRSKYVAVVMNIEEPKVNSFESEEPLTEKIDTEEVTDDEISKIEVYEVPFVDPTTQQHSVAHRTDYIAASAMIAMLNVGATGFNDGLYYDSSAVNISDLRSVFERIFKVLHQEQHLKMMIER